MRKGPAQGFLDEAAATAGKDRATELLERAAEEVRPRIESDQQRVSADLKPALGYIAEKLLAGGFTIAGLREATGLDHARNRSFHEQLGALPRDYCGARRMDAALWLVRETDLKLWQIADLLGYSQSFAFTRAFQKHTGQTPSGLREGASPVAGRAACSAQEEVSWKLWVGANVAAVEPEEARRVIGWRHLQVSPGELAQASGAVLFSVEAPEQQGPMAEALWRKLQTLPLADQRDLVSGIAFHTPALFHLLGKKSLAEGRTDRRRGIFLARLALASIEASRGPLGEAYHDLRALGSARLGNAWRLANRHREAEEAFARAEDAWAAERQSIDRRAEAEILRLKASLRQYQRRFPEAMELVSRATALCQLAGDRRQIVYCSVQRAILCVYSGQPRAALPVLSEADQLARQQLGKPELRLFVLQVSAGVHTLLGDYAAAEPLLPVALELCEDSRRPDGTCQVRWLQGLASRGRGRLEQAATRLAEAHSGFEALGDMDSAAMVALDEAALQLRRGRTSEVVRLAAESIPVFEALELDREGLATLALLREAVTADAVTPRVLRELRVRFAQLFPDSLTALLAAG